jgi:hypothetical protein
MGEERLPDFMKSHLIAQLQSVSTRVLGRNFTREYLQAQILSSLQKSGAMVPLAFHGGTALRFLYNTQRYSEDLDFALDGDRRTYNFRGYLKSIRSNLDAQGYQVDLRINDQRSVHSALIRFPGLLYDLGLSPHRDEIFAVRLEVDTDPPMGAGLVTTIVRRHVILNLQHHDQASLFAGKLHAILQRKYLKGRDVYDLLWYLSDPDWPTPNLVMLNNALRQTGWGGEVITADNWREVLRTRFDRVDWEAVTTDVRPFIENPHELAFLTKETLSNYLMDSKK